MAVKDPGSNRSTARKLTLTNRFGFKNTLGGTDKIDSFLINVTQSRSFNFRLSGFKPGVDVVLIGPNRTRVVLKSGNKKIQAFRRNLQKGTYYLQLKRSGTAAQRNVTSKYSMVLTSAVISTPPSVTPPSVTPPPVSPPPVSPPPADEAGNSFGAPKALTGALNPSVLTGRIGDLIDNVRDTDDFYSFTVGADELNSELQVDLTGLTANANLTLWVPNATTGLPSATVFSTNAGTAAEKIQVDATPLPVGSTLTKLATAGTYYIQVNWVDGQAAGTPYTLTTNLFYPDNVGDAVGTVVGDDTVALVSDTAGRNESLQSLKNEFAGSSKLSGNTVVADVDVYNFTINPGKSKFVDIRLNNAGTSGDLDIELYKQGTATPIFSSTRSGVDGSGFFEQEQITQLLAEGTYYVKVFSKNGVVNRTKYQLTVDSSNELINGVLTKDIRTGTSSSSPSSLTASSGTVFFLADDGTGKTLYNSDGSSDGTVKVNGLGTFNEFPQFATLSDNSFFLVNGGKLFTGTAAGGAEATEVNDDLALLLGTSNTNDLNIRSLTAFGDSLYFLASTVLGGSGEGLFRLKRTTGNANPAGEFEVVQVVAPAANVFTGSVLAKAGDALYFTKANGLVTNTELFRVANASEFDDGTTVLSDNVQFVKDINADTNAGSNINNFVAIGNQLYFTATGASGNQQVWTIADVTNPSDPVELAITGSAPEISNLTVVGSTLFFVGKADSSSGAELYKTTGSTPQAITGAPDFINPGKLTTSGTSNVLYFLADSDTNNADGVNAFQVFKIGEDGSGLATLTNSTTDSAFYNNLAAAGTSLFFTGGGTLFESSAGGVPAEVKGENGATGAFGDIGNLTAAGDRLYFTATGKDSFNNNVGLEVFATDA